MRHLDPMTIPIGLCYYVMSIGDSSDAVQVFGIMQGVARAYGRATQWEAAHAARLAPS